MDMMTSCERITNALEGKLVDRIPFCPFLAYVWESFPQDLQARGQLAFHHQVGADPLWRGAPCPVAQTTTGVDTQQTNDGEQQHVTLTTPVGTLYYTTRLSPSGNTWFLVEHPLKTEEDFKVQLWIEEHTSLRYDPREMAAHFAGEGREGLSLGMLFPRGKTAFQSLIEHYVGTEELNYALCDFPETVEALCQVMVENDLLATRLAAEADYQYFITWEDSSTTNYSPAQYDRYIGSEIRQMCDILRGHGKSYIQHACGHLHDLVGRMLENGVKAVESISPPPTGNITIRDARARIGDGMGIIGGIEPTEFLNRSLAELEPYVEQVIADAAGGPFVLANSDSCPPGVTLEKFKLVADVVRRVRVP